MTVASQSNSTVERVTGTTEHTIQDAVAHAARIVAPLWPIDGFVAVNPMEGMVDRGFEEATAAARRWLGASPMPGAATARAAIARGRLTREELVEDMAHDLPVLTSFPDLVSGPGAQAARVRPVELAVADLLDGLGPVGPPTAPRTVLERADHLHGTGFAAAVDAEIGRWCTQLVGTRHRHHRGGDHGFWHDWSALARHDRRLRRLFGRRSRHALAALAPTAEEAVESALAGLGIGTDRMVEELRGQLARVPGWAGWARWSTEWATAADPAPRLALVDLLAVQLTCDALALELLADAGSQDGDAARDARDGRDADRVVAALTAVDLDPADDELRDAAAKVLGCCTADQVGRCILGSLERSYRTDLLGRLDGREAGPVVDAVAQVVCCIDVRSEGLRRHLESLGRYDTVGFAGFFAVPLRFRALGSAEAVPQAPALLTPEVEVPEVESAESDGTSGSLAARRQGRARVAAAYDELAHGPLSMYALAEAAGWILGPRALAATLAPGARRSRAESSGQVVVDDRNGGGFDLDARTEIAESALRTMGLTSGFAPLVVLCGHGSSTTANPHASSLDCGACGGNPGGANARGAANILNEPQVRAALVGRGIDIPATTWFLAGEHDTTTDEVRLLDAVPSGHEQVVGDLARDLAEAGRRNARDRMGGLPGGDPGRADAASVRARDWAQTRPEWGLAGNAAFIVGPRDLTRNVDLGGRAFLHSYDADADESGAVLDAILTAPLVVAHWINMQYYGSTVDPRCWGAGDKTLHNALPGVGVLEGAGTDLRPGLPWQSVADHDGPRHEPQRLLAVVDAPIERIEASIARHRVLADLFDGGWVHLAAPAPDDPARWLLRRPGGGWSEGGAS